MYVYPRSSKTESVLRLAFHQHPLNGELVVSVCPRVRPSFPELRQPGRQRLLVGGRRRAGGGRDGGVRGRLQGGGGKERRLGQGCLLIDSKSILYML